MRDRIVHSRSSVHIHHSGAIHHCRDDADRSHRSDDIHQLFRSFFQRQHLSLFPVHGQRHDLLKNNKFAAAHSTLHPTAHAGNGSARSIWHISEHPWRHTRHDHTG